MNRAQTAQQHANVIFDNQQPSQTDSRSELMAGLNSPQKRVNPKFFYDKYGSELFEKITEVPEYYPTRTERAILADNAIEIARLCGDNCVLIEPGSGSSEKVRLLLGEVDPVAYVPLDISADFLYESAIRLGREFPNLTIHAVCADFSDEWQASRDLPAGKRVIFYPGSTIGNMEPGKALAFLRSLHRLTGDDGGVLIGVDVEKSATILNAAYNDSQGITADFNLNILNSLNAILQADFSTERFQHHAFYNRDKRRIEMHLVSPQAQTVKTGSGEVSFAANETIHTENSYKYSVENFQALADKAGFQVKKTWLDKDQLFAVYYLSGKEL